MQQTFELSGRTFKLEQKLGEGAFGEVFKVSEEGYFDNYLPAFLKALFGNSMYAIKEIKSINTIEAFIFVIEEVIALIQCRHENIVTLYDFFYDQQSSPRKGLILMEYCDGGNLNSRLAKQPITDELELRWMRELASAVSFMHSKDIVHRDLKPENVLLTSSDSIKLADFGLARHYTALREGDASDQALATHMATYYMETQAGTIVWMAPEVFDGHYTEKADIFSLGAIFYTIQTRSSITIGGREYFGAFVKLSGRDVGIGMAMHQDKKVKLPVGNISPQSRQNLIQQMTMHNPKKRPNAKEVKESLDNEIQNGTTCLVQ